MFQSSFIKLFLFLIVCISFYSCGKNPDIIYTNGKIYTLDANNSVVEAIAVKDGKILDLGSSEQINDEYSSDNVVDLGGAAVLPGFMDADGSLTEFSKNLNFINLSLTKSVDEIKGLIAERVRTAKDGEWIGGMGWSFFNFPKEELQKIWKEALDEVAPDNPVYLVSVTGNIVWVNSKLLDALSITKETPSPEGGEIELDESGELTGLFFDNAVSLVRDNVPEISAGDMRNYLHTGAGELLKYGITEIFDRTISIGALELAKELSDSNKFPVRLYVILSGEDPEIEKQMKNEYTENYKGRITVRAVSLDYDGVFEFQDAAMNDDFLKEPFRKVPYSDASDIEKVYTLALENKFQFFVKAVGDRAVTSSLEAIGKVNKEKNPLDPRTVIEYAEFINPRDLEMIKDQKVIPSIRPEICIFDIAIVPDLIMNENVQKLGLWNSLLQSAGMVISGSDFPFHHINPLIQIYYLVTRQQAPAGDGTTVAIPNPDQKLSLLNAVKSFTVWPAYASFQENSKGTLEKNKIADMVVLSNDIFNIDPKELINTVVLKTIIDGNVVYDINSIQPVAGK
jgi:predicted amidohydrolase YtcJ